MADLGDLGAFLKEGAVPNLDWLEVDPAEYRAQDTLPKQNLDVVPDLEALWSHEDKPASSYVENKGSTPVQTSTLSWQPHTMGDLSEEHGVLRAKPEDIRKVARLTLMQSVDQDRFRDTLLKKFDRASLRAAKDVIASVLAERGLIGKLYIEAKDFPGCDNGSKHPIDFVRRYANEARFVVAKAECGGCSHAMNTVTGKTTCSVFHKEIKLEVPYSDELATEIERAQRAKGKIIEMTAGENPKKRVRLAMLAEDYRPQEGALAPKPKDDVVRLMRQAEAREDYVGPVGKTARESLLSLVRREMLKGRGKAELASVVKHAAQSNDLQAMADDLKPLLKEAGLYGSIYTTQDSFSDCREGADFLATHNPGVRGVVAGSKCSGCIYNKMARCLMYGKPLVKEASELYTQETVDKVAHGYRIAGYNVSSVGANARTVLASMHEAVRSQVVREQQMPSSRVAQSLVQAHTMNRSGENSLPWEDPKKREIVKTAHRFMNEGLYGADLLASLKSRFQTHELAAVASELRPVVAEQGLQGIHYIDPTAYDDYGKGCKEAASLHRTRLVPYLKQGSKCGSCVHQSKPGFCSVINKPLVAEPPYVNKAAQQREVLASGKSTEISYESLMNNGLTMMAEYQLQHGGLSVDLDPVKVADTLGVEFGNAGQGVKL